MATTDNCDKVATATDTKESVESTKSEECLNTAIESQYRYLRSQKLPLDYFDGIPPADGTNERRVYDYHYGQCMIYSMVRRANEIGIVLYEE